jgi:hypothetical protein
MSLFGHAWRHLTALLGYGVVAIAFSWPLVLNLDTHLTGAPTGDTGVYVWNQWVFHREIVDNGNLPYFTNAIFSTSDPANLSLHNYTTFQNLLALPLIGFLGVVTTFNVVFLAMTVATAYAMFLLAFHVTQRPAESWLAGVLFAWSPMLVTRAGGHFSLVAAAPLAIFALLLLRHHQCAARWHPWALGATMWWAASTDAYYGVYCLLMAIGFVAVRAISVERRVLDRGRGVVRGLDVLIVSTAVLILSLVLGGGWRVAALGLTLSVRGLHTPVLVLTALVALRLAWPHRGRLTLTRADAWTLARTGSIAAAVTAVMLAPRLYAVGVHIATSGLDGPPVFWRSSPQGIDLLALVLPNPNHPWTPDAVRAWLTPRPDAYLENVASLTLVALGVVLIARLSGWRLPRMWTGVALGFGALALGPFVQFAGINTYIPGPWALLRYLPVIGLARTPGRFTVVLMLALCVLFAGALVWIGQRWPQRRKIVLGTVALLLLFELFPAPRPLYSAAVPRLYDRVAAAPTGTRVLELPFGIRDGTSSLGNFTARSQYFQTYHGKLLIGGYLSRVSNRRRSLLRSNDMLDALMTLSAGDVIPEARWRHLAANGSRFAEQARIGFVVIDATRKPEPLRRFAQEAFQLERLDSAGDLELYRPGGAAPAH